MVYNYNELNAFGNEYTTLEVPVTGYNGQAVRFAIFAGSSASGGDNRLVIDNVAVEIGTSCKRPTELAVTDITANGATIGWTENGEATAWVVAYMNAMDSVYTELTVSTTNFTFTTLEPEMGYEVKVRPVCSDGAMKWSSTVNFTTLASCSPAFELAATEITTNSATFSWNSNAGSYIIMLNDSVIAVSQTTTYQLTGLAANTQYTFAVQAVCGDHYPLRC